MDTIYKRDFPIFHQKENEGIIYFDNAATTQRPQCVIKAMEDFYRHNNANPLRGLYDLCGRATEDYENARNVVASFLNAHPCEIIFTRNTTESLNLIAYSYALDNVGEGDEIALLVSEHHSNILPWQMVAQKSGARLNYIEIDRETGEIPEAEFSKISEKTKVVAVAHVSNVLGMTFPVKKIARLTHDVGAVCVVDGAQSTPHIKVDVRDIDADFFAFSGHKLCGPMGIGVLYAKRALLEKMRPFLRGGEMIEYVKRESATWAELPHKFEAGTVNAADAVGLSAAIKYIGRIGFEKISSHDNALAELLISEMKKIPHVHTIGSPDAKKHCGIVTFTIDGVHPHDIASVLDSEKIAIRAGHHCAQVLGEYIGVPASARASMYFYNTEEEVLTFTKKLSQVRKWMGFND